MNAARIDSPTRSLHRGCCHIICCGTGCIQAAIGGHFAAPCSLLRACRLLCGGDAVDAATPVFAVKSRLHVLVVV